MAPWAGLAGRKGTVPAVTVMTISARTPPSPVKRGTSRAKYKVLKTQSQIISPKDLSAPKAYQIHSAASVRNAASAGPGRRPGARAHAGVHEVLVLRGAVRAEAGEAVGRGRTESASAPLQSRACGPGWDTGIPVPAPTSLGATWASDPPLELVSPPVKSLLSARGYWA